MKKIVIILTIAMLFASCQSNGFINETGQKVELGSQSSVDIFNEIDKAWAATDYEKLKSLIHTEGKFTTSKGEVFNSSDEFVQWIENDYKTTIESGKEFGWTTEFAFAVKVTQGQNLDNDDGDYVNARFTSKTDGTVYDEWYYIVDNKLKSWEQSKQSKKKNIDFIYDATYLDEFTIGDDELVLKVQQMHQDIIKKNYEKVSDYLSDEVVFALADGSRLEGKKQCMDFMISAYSKIEIEDYKVGVNFAVTGENGDEWVLLWDNANIVSYKGRGAAYSWMEAFQFDKGKIVLMNQYSKPVN